MLQAIAYRILRCKADAEDIVQDTFIKWLNVEQEKIQNTKAYLIGAVTNNCINHLNTLKKKKELYIDSIDFSKIKAPFIQLDLKHFDLDAELSAAFTILQHKLEPLERAVYLLKEVFNMDYETLQEILDKKQDHCRQIVCRARKKLQTESSRINATLPNRSKMMKSFRNACEMGQAMEFITELKRDINTSISRKK